MEFEIPIVFNKIGDYKLVIGEAELTIEVQTEDVAEDDSDDDTDMKGSRRRSHHQTLHRKGNEPRNLPMTRTQMRIRKTQKLIKRKRLPN